MDKYRVVFHLDGPNQDRVDQVFSNIENLPDDLGDNNNVEVELVANGGGVKARVEGPDSHAEQVGRLAARGVLLAACAHSLSQLEIARDALLGIDQGRLIRRRGTGQKAGGGMGIYSALTWTHSAVVPFGVGPVSQRRRKAELRCKRIAAGKSSPRNGRYRQPNGHSLPGFGPV